MALKAKQKGSREIYIESQTVHGRIFCKKIIIGDQNDAPQQQSFNFSIDKKNKNQVGRTSMEKTLVSI